MSNPNLLPIVDRLCDICRELEERKALYREFDELIRVLAKSGESQFETSDGRILNVIDNFAQSNTGWTRAAVKRYDAEIISHELKEKRERRIK